MFQFLKHPLYFGMEGVFTIFLATDLSPGWGTPSVIYGAEDIDGESCMEGVTYIQFEESKNPINAVTLCKSNELWSTSKRNNFSLNPHGKWRPPTFRMIWGVTIVMRQSFFFFFQIDSPRLGLTIWMPI